MPLAAAWVTADTVSVAATVFATLILAQWLPWQAGRWWKARRPPTPWAQRLLERAASASVLTLIGGVAWQSWPQLLEHPRVTVVASIVAIVLALASAVDTADRLEAMGVVKNLTLVTLVLTQSRAPQDAMTALAAFGAVMYPAAWLASQRGAALARRPPLGSG